MARFSLLLLSIACAVNILSFSIINAQVTPTPTSSASASPSVGSSPTPSPSSRPLPIGAIREIFTMDCNGGLHILPGHPLEVNVNLRGVRQILNVLAEEIRQHAKCTAARYVNGATQPLCAELTDEHILRHFIPSIPMLLNFIEPLNSRRSVPSSCMQRSESDSDNGKPAFAQTFWDTSAMSTVIADYFNFTRLPLFLNMPSTCTYETYMGGVGCKFMFNEPVSYTNIQVGIDTCPNSYVPFISATCKGPWCSSFFRPCLANSDCGTSGLVCRNLEVEGSKRSTLQSWLFNLNLAKNAAELDTCQDPITFETGQPMLANKLRTKLYSIYNMTVPTNTNPDILFCLPTDSQWENIQQRLKNSFNEYWETDLSKDPTVGKQTSQCIDSGCDPLMVGDGTCQLACMNEECKWDGGDCGGPFVRDVAASAYVDQSLVGDTCTIQQSTVADGEYKWKNVWERCNRWGTCLNSVPAQCSCRTCPFKSGQTTPGSQCENCAVETFCPGPKCKYASRHLIGIQDRLQPWDGLRYDGFSVFDFDRKSGINYTTPAAIFEPATVLNGLQRTIVEFTCAGELGVVAGNGFLQFGVHAPWLQDIAAFLGNYVADLAQCRIKNINGGQLSDAQIETRFMAHHPAFWFYQMFYLGQSFTLNNPNPLAFGGYNTLGSLFVNSDPYSFGYYDLVDPLMNKGLRREPTFPPTPTPAGLGWLIQNSDWARSFRMYPPSMTPLDGDPSADCDWHSAVGRDGYGRRCRGTFKAFGKLFNSITNPNFANLHNIYFDLKLDRGGNNPLCTGAATGQRIIPSAPTVSGAPYPTAILTAAQAKYILPSLSIVYEGQGVPIADYPVPCNTDLDCLSRFPQSEAACVDLDTQLLGLKGTYKNRNVDPLGSFIYGLYNVDRVTNQLPGNRDTCSSTQAVDTTLRQFLINIGGRQRDNGKSSKFCFMKPFNAANKKEYHAWQDIVYDKGTCDLTRDYNDDNRMCVATLPVSASNAPFKNLPTGRPAKVNGFAYLPNDFNIPQSQSGIMPFQPNSRYGGTFNGYGGRMDTVFYLSLPVLHRNAVTNQHRENFRWAIATAMAQFSMGVTPDNVLIISIDDNPFGFQPLPDGSRAGISVGFVLEIPDRSTAANISAELRSNRPGSLGSRAGAVFATLGIVPFRYQREVIFGIRPPIGVAPSGLSGGEIFGIILLVTVIVGLAVYFIRGGTVHGMVSSAKGLVDKTKALSIGRMNVKKKRGVGEVVGKPDSPQRKSSSVEELNPMSSGGSTTITTTTTTTVSAAATARANLVGQMMTPTNTTTVTIHDAVHPPTATAPVLPSQMYVSASKAATMPPPTSTTVIQSYPPTMVASHPIMATVPVTQPVMAPTAPPSVTVVGNPFSAVIQQQQQGPTQ